MTTVTKVEWKTARIRIEGQTPLLCDRFPREFGEGTRPKIKEQKDIETAFHHAYYPIQNGKEELVYGFPVDGIKKCFVNAARFTGHKMTRLRPTLFVQPTHGEYVQILSKNGDGLIEPYPHTYPVDTGGRGKVYTVVARFDEWAMEFDIQYFGGELEPSDLANLMESGGNFVGLGTCRPEKGRLFGKFSILRDK